MKKFFEEFKAFISKGNILDLALAVIMGNAFNKIVNSLVTEIITPILGVIIGNVKITDLKWVIRPAEVNNLGEVINPELAITYGVFIQAIIDFITIAFFLFLAVKIITASRKKIHELGSEVEHVWKKLSKAEKKQIKKQAKLENKSSAEIIKQNIGANLAEENCKNIAEAMPKDTKEISVELLTEIRDLLKEQVKNNKNKKDAKN